MTDCLISLDTAQVHLPDGETVPVTNWFDEDGDDCAPADAVALVAGPDTQGMWLTLEISGERGAGPTTH